MLTALAVHVLTGSLAQLPAAPYHCKFYPNSARVTDVSFADPTIHEAVNISRPPDCCAACSAWNAAKPRSAADNCTIGVYSGGNHTCALKATATRPFETTDATAVYCEERRAPPHVGHMDLIVLPNKSSVDRGAVCLDGSPPAIYFRAANSTAEPGAETRWVLYFKGGGWCYDEADCASRSRTTLGSSHGLSPMDAGGAGGPLTLDPAANPTFANANHVHIMYCDGGSFSGDKSEPIDVNGTKLFFRGRRILDAVLDFLKVDHGLAMATEVLLSGGSAGGLSTFLHADYVRSQFGQEVMFGAAPVSGFFLLHDTAQGLNVYPARMQYVYDMMNSSGAVNQRCRATVAPAEAWKCIFANYSYAHTQTPMFPLQSSVDAWQMGAIFDLDGAGAAGCTKTVLAPGGSSHQLQNCTELQRRAVAQYQRDFLADLKASASFDKPGNGGYVESCIEHVAAQGTAFNTFRNGASGLTMQQALTAWWESGLTAPAASHWQLPCMLHPSGAFGQCNPTCTAN